MTVVEVLFSALRKIANKFGIAACQPFFLFFAVWCDFLFYSLAQAFVLILTHRISRIEKTAVDFFVKHSGRSTMEKRFAGYNLIRSIAFISIFLYHITLRQVENAVVQVVIGTSAAISISLFGFISSVLLSEKETSSGVFLIRRLTRIYVPLILCLMTVLGLHALVGQFSFGRGELLHLLGFSAFLKILRVDHQTVIGSGLWFVTTIVVMYFLLPVLQQLFRHEKRLWNLLGFIAVCTLLNFTIGAENIFTLAIAFAIGVYFSVNRWIEKLEVMRFSYSIPCALAMYMFMLFMIFTFDPWSPLPQLVFSISAIAFMPVIFKLAAHLPRWMVVASTLFSSLSYEFYILHFYFINEGFNTFFKLRVGVVAQIGIAFSVVFILSFILSRIGFVLSRKINSYLCGPPKVSGLKHVASEP